MTPYYSEDGIALYLGDCREILPHLAITDAQVIADPPYNQTSLAWDRWQTGWPSAISTSIRSLWCFGSMRMFMLNSAEFDRGGWKLSQDIVWEKHNGSSFHADRFRRVHESICHFYRGTWEDLNLVVPTTPDAIKRTTRRKMRPTHMGHIDVGPFTSEDGGPRLMRSVVFHPSMHGTAQHPTEKPVELLKPLIQYGGSASSMVVVPFAGAGSELLAARELGHSAIGMEISEKYCEIAANRLRAESGQLV